MSDSEKTGKLSSLRRTMKRLSGQMPKTEAFYQRKISEYEEEVEALQTQVKTLEEEIYRLKRHRDEFEFLRAKLSQAKEELEQAHQQNEKLVRALHQARDQIQALREEVDKLSAPPSSYGIFSSLNQDGTANIYLSGRKMKVNLHPSIDAKGLRRGQELILNEALNVIEVSDFDVQGEVVHLKELLERGRAIISLRTHEERVAELAEPLQSEKLSIGDHLLFDPRSGYLLEKLPKAEVEDLILEEVPNITYEDVGGLDHQIEMIKDAIELPYLYREYFREHKLQPPKELKGDLYQAKGATQVPQSFNEAVQEWAKSQAARESFGEEVADHYLHAARMEARFFDKTVACSERERYFERI